MMAMLGNAASFLRARDKDREASDKRENESLSSVSGRPLLQNCFVFGGQERRMQKYSTRPRPNGNKVTLTAIRWQIPERQRRGKF